MTEYELDKIKKSFVRSNAKCPVEVACLLTVIKYYNGKETDIHTLTEWCKINGKLTLAGMKQGAIYSGMKAEICLQNIHQLTQRKLPIYKPQNKMFHFCKTFCSKITLVNTIQNVILNRI